MSTIRQEWMVRYDISTETYLVKECHHILMAKKRGFILCRCWQVAEHTINSTMCSIAFHQVKDCCVTVFAVSGIYLIGDKTEEIYVGLIRAKAGLD